MEEDKLLRFHERLKDFLQKHLTLFLNLVLAFVIVIILGGAWVYYQKNKEKKTYEELFQILHKNDMVALQNFAKKSVGSQAGLNAALIIWDSLSSSNDLKAKREILALLKKSYPKGFKNLLLYTEAKILEDSGKIEEALKYYQELMEKEPLLKEILYLDLGRLYATKNPTQAKRYYKELIDKYPKSFGAPLANYKISTLP